MFIGRLIGFVLLVIAAIAVLRDALDWYDSGVLQLMSGDQLWLGLSPDSYQFVDDWAVTHLSVAWDPVVTTILSIPAFVSAGVLGALFMFASRKRRKRNRRPGSNLRPVYR